MRTNIVKWTHRINYFKNAFIFNWNWNVWIIFRILFAKMQLDCGLSDFETLKWRDFDPYAHNNIVHTILKVKQAKNHSEIMSMTNWFLRVGSLLVTAATQHQHFFFSRSCALFLSRQFFFIFYKPAFFCWSLSFALQQCC